MGSWQAGTALFAASVWGAGGTCARNGSIPQVAWLDSVASYHRSGDGWELRDAAGDTVATLRVDGEPPTINSVIDDYNRAPVVTERTRAHFAATPPLPGSLRPADTSGLVGRWVPASGTRSDSHAVFAADGMWTGSDGCNGGGGRWMVGADGEFLSTSGVSTLMACDGVAVPSWVSTARLAAFDGQQLVLLDAAGAELARLVPRG